MLGRACTQALSLYKWSASSSQLAVVLPSVSRMFSDKPASPAQPDSDAAKPSTESDQTSSSTNSKPKQEWYSSTPLMMDAKSNAPLKSSEYASSHDDKFGVQKNWFTSLYKQLNYYAKTGSVPGLKGRQREVFEAVEREFEGLYNKYIHASGLTGMEHRAMLMMCLSIATYRILNDEIADAALVRDTIRTNQGSLMMAVLLPLHRMRLWLLRNLLAQDPHKLAVEFLPALQQDMGALCTSEVRVGPPEAATGDAAAQGQAPGQAAGPGAASSDEVSLVVKRCMYHEVLTKEDAPFLLSEFCCHHGMVWLNEFRKYGVDVNMERCMAWDDECCTIRVAKQSKPL